MTQRSQPPRTRPFSLTQRVVLALALVAPAVALGALAGRLLGLLSTDQMTTTALGAGENPGTFIFAAMFLATPIQWLTGRSQIRIRKALAIIFYGLAVNNFVMFLVERQHEASAGLVGEIMSSPLLLAGAIALLVATPLFLTSSRWSQRWLGMRRWRLLHKLTYVVAAALLLHVLLIPDIGPDTALLTAGFVARLPAVRRRLVARSRRKHDPAQLEPAQLESVSGLSKDSMKAMSSTG